MIFYFGTFNPIHNGHLYIAEKITELYNDTVVFVPAYDSPWKPDLKESFEHRCNMIKLCGGEVSDIERNLPTPSYTYQTVEELFKKYNPVKMIVGYDQFFSLEKWKHPEILQTYCEFIVIPRDIGGCWGDWKFEYKKMKSKGWKASLVEMPLQDVSSSLIRKLLSEKKPCSYVPESVLDYIYTNNLY